MASFYTYGAVPSIDINAPDEEPVGLGYLPTEGITASPLMSAFEEEPAYTPRGETVPVTPLAQPVNEEVEAPVYTPRGENVPVSPLATANAPAPASLPPAAAQYDEKGNLIASSDSPLTAGNSDWIKRMQAFGAAPSLVPNLVTIGTGGKDISAGDLFKTKKEQAIKTFEERLKSVEAGGYLTPEVEQSLKDNLAYQLEQISAGESAYLNSLPQRKVLSDLLKNNQFSDAIKYAQDNGMQTLLTRPDELSNLRQPFTKDEARQFMRSLTPEFFKSAYGDQYEYDKAWKFDPEGAEERGALAWVSGAGTPGMAMSETGYPMLDRVLKPQEVKKDTGIFEKIFKGAAIAAAIFGGAQALGALGGTGSVSAAGGATAGGAGAGAGAAGAGATGAGAAGGLGAAGAAGTGAAVAAAPLAEVVITATKLGLTVPQAAALIGATGAATGALTGGAGTTTAAPTQPAPTEPAPLEEVVVTGTKPIPTAGPLTGAVAATPEFVEPPVKGPAEPLDEVVVETTRPIEPELPPLAPPVEVAPPPEGPLDEVVIETTRPTEPKLPPLAPPVEVAPPPEGPLDEVVIETTRPPKPEAPPVAVPPGTVSAPSPEGPLDEVVIKTTKPTKPNISEPPPIVINPGDILKDYKPTQVKKSPLDQVKALLENFEDFQKLLKLLGALGAVSSSGKGAPKTSKLPSGFGGALPKYEIKRTALKPDIDYYKYGYGPEALFFEDKVTQVAPSEGSDSETTNPEDDGYAQGGLAAGGRYVNGPGSGRDDKIPALLSDGEYVIDAETLALLGDGSPKEGAKRMDKFRANIRKHKGNALSRGRISPDAKSPSKYMGGGLT